MFLIPRPYFGKTLHSHRLFSPAGLAIVILFAACLTPAAWSFSVEQTTINGRANPLGIASDDISFSWAIAAETRGVVQSAYCIRVGTKEGDDNVWDSGRVASARQVDITLPAAVRLMPATRYYWQVKIWNGDGTASNWSSSWFETGLLPALLRRTGEILNRSSAMG